jgi:DNA polymerase bacteriophage-type
VLDRPARDERALGSTFALADVGFLDFESRSAVPISHGTYRYACEADAIVLAYAIGEQEPQAVAVGDFSGPLRGKDLPADFRAHHARVAKGEAVWCAWNAGFDKAIWNYATIGFPLLPPCHIIDAMAQATASGLPPDLAGAAKAVGTPFLKDKRGADLIKLFCLPGNPLGDPLVSPAQWADFLDYAKADVAALRGVFLGTRQLPLAEWREYWAMESINERGIGLNLAFVNAAAALAQEDRFRARAELAKLTEGAVGSVDEVAKLTAWLKPRLLMEARSILLDREERKDDDGEVVEEAKHALDRGRVARLIAFLSDPKYDTPAHRAVLRVLQIRLYGGAKTPAKFAKMLTQHVDGVLFGQYVFNGAGQTGRASSRGIQIHNLARDTLAKERRAIDAILAGDDWDNLTVYNPDPIPRQLSLLIRPALVPAEGNVFIWSDWAQIEARILPWLAGAHERLRIFSAHDADPLLPDLYTQTAAQLSNVSLAAVTPALRQRGKVAELALGFAGGRGALQNMAAAFGLHIDDGEARRIVETWRRANAWCMAFWNELGQAAQQARTMPGVTVAAGRLRYVYLREYLGGSLVCQLPSGRCLTYRQLRRERVDIKDSDDKVIGREMQWRFARGHGRVQLWRGILVENAVQAVAADCLRATLVTLEQEGYRVRLHSHDEILVECEERAARAIRYGLRGVMQRGFDWSAGLPLTSEETIATYYSKHPEARYAV